MYIYTNRQQEFLKTKPLQGIIAAYTGSPAVANANLTAAAVGNGFCTARIENTTNSL